MTDSIPQNAVGLFFVYSGTNYRFKQKSDF